MSQIAQSAAAWLLSYAVHSTVLLGAAALITTRLRDHARKETLWKAALLGGLITVPAQSLAGLRPVVGTVSLAAPAAPAPTADPALPASNLQAPAKQPNLEVHGNPTIEPAAAPAVSPWLRESSST